MTLASDALRSELIFLPDDGSVTRLPDGLDGFRILTPSNPTYWWGNSLRFDHAPRDGDFARWMDAFDVHVHAVQPTSSHHRTFGWDGDETGIVAPFVAAGFEYFETIGLTAADPVAIRAPHFDATANVVRIEDDAWLSLHALLVETRGPKHSESGYAEFAARQIVGWRTLEACGQGCWFGVRDGARVIAALGVFAEAQRGADGRRIGRFQQVVTHPSMRRRGLCGTLVERATRHAFECLDVNSLRISADENDVARRVYEACGYRITSRHRGLERES